MNKNYNFDKTDEAAEEIDSLPLLIEWRICQHTMFIYEIATKEARKFVPNELVLVETKPNVSLLNIAVVDFQGGNLKGNLPPFTECSVVFHVQPDLSVNMPIPRFAFYAHRINSQCEGFLANEHKNLLLPTYHIPQLSHQFGDNNSISLHIDKEKVIALNNTYLQPINFQHEDLWGQFFVNYNNRIRMGIWSWSGIKYEHQTKGDYGFIKESECLNGINPDKIKSNHLQMLSKKGEIAYQRFWGMKTL